uniref:Rieske domain-containing protein n=1 Tax=Fibrocapsa japonica TaxID=94617 RepID=A0A7S2V0A4_9STRA|mmetsp:Transcript_22979/g.33331  ORF Transcript_22979/g.33331 Transcript_22979/m.33331 type:complete len:196 (+) Transcript_22979:164-751(+)
MMKTFVVVLLCIAAGVNAFLPAPGMAGSSAVRATSSQLKMGGVPFAPTKEEWIPVLKKSEIAAGELVPVEQDGLQLLVIADFDGSIYCTANICPHLGTPMDQGSLGDGTIVCPLHKSAFSLETGELAGDWCPFPPLLGPLVLGKLEPAKNLATFAVRAKGDSIEVLVNRNLKQQFESKYWAGILDAQGKATGDYY